MALTMGQMRQDPVLARFLYASVGKDKNGTNVSVLSMLSRLEVDPWTEASDLAAMPDGPARKRLATLMASFKDVPSLRQDQGKIISILLDLLPRRKGTTNPNYPNVATGLPALATRVPIFWYIIVLLILSWITNLALGR
jgi:hypothetical protein